MNQLPKDWICPICGEAATQESRCRCTRHDGECPNGHKFHTCAVHDRTVPGASDHEQKGCTCVGSYKTDPIRRLRACFNLAWLGWENNSGRNKKEQISRMGSALKRIAMMAAKGAYGRGVEEQIHTHISGCEPPRPDVPEFPPDVEILASAHHESWSGWCRCMLRQLEKQLLEELYEGTTTWEPTFVLVDAKTGEPVEKDAVRGLLGRLDCVQRWRRQMETAYEDLPEKEKKSDRTEVAKHIVDYRPWYFDGPEGDKIRAQRRLDSGIPAKGEPNAR